jgi:CheY-like chemotaxis protein/HPt (histidine-containing phosphotransfer) domain-containing protein
MVPSAAASAIEALDFVRHGHAFDVAILDMSMPEMDGLGLANEIRKYRGPDALPLIMLTSVSHRPRDSRLNQVQFAAYLNKPIKPSALFDVLLHSMKIAPEAVPVAKSAAAEGRPGDTMPLSILVAEDNAVNQKVVQQLLAHLGYRADVVANGVEVLDALERQSYDVVLMDVQMPEMDGLEATRRLRKRYGHGTAPHVIAMTANAMPGDREKCLAAGMDAYVAKPVELTDLRAVLVSVATTERTAPVDDGSDVIDRRRIAQLLEVQDENNPTLVADIVNLFINDAPQHLSNLANALAKGDAALLESSAHRFLSGIDNLGARRMHEHCVEIERLAKHGELTAAAEHLPRLEREFEVARQHLISLATPV